MSESAGFRSLNARLGPAARVAAVLAALGVIVFLFSLRSLGKAFMTPSAKQAKQEVNEQIKKIAADYALGLDGQVKQFNGRSVFFIPSPPIPPPPPAPTTVDEGSKPPPPPPPPPATYGGPKLIAMINGVAWFDDGKKMGVGDAVKDKLKVKEVLAPWGALVDWDGVEFKVSLFDQDAVVYPKKKEEIKVSATEAAKDLPVKDGAKETPPPDVKAGDKPESPMPEVPKPDAPKPDQPEEPKPEQPKTVQPDSPGSPEGQTEKNE